MHGTGGNWEGSWEALGGHCMVLGTLGEYWLGHCMALGGTGGTLNGSGGYGEGTGGTWEALGGASGRDWGALEGH